MFYQIRKSLRLKLVLASVIVELVMLTILLGNSLRIVNSSIDHQAVIKKESITPLLDSALSIPLFERDPATLHELLKKLTEHKNSEFIYISVYDDHGNIFSEIKSEIKGAEKDDLSYEKILHISAPLTIANEKIGSVKYGLSIQSLYDSKSTLFNQGLIIAFFEIILTILLLGLASYFLTRHVTVLLKCAEEIASGNYNIDIPVQTPDEIGLLANEFNIMAKAIQNRIIELSETSNALSIKTAEFESIFNSIADSVIFVNTDRVCVSVNPATVKMFDYPLNEFLNKRLDFLYLYKDEYDVQGVLRFAKDSPDRNDSFEASYVRSDGSVFKGELLASRVTDENGNKLGFIGILRNITERKLQEEQLRRTHKMDALGKLTGGIAHDYNNMLGVILGYTDLLDISLKNQPELEEYVKEITHAAERGVNLTKKLLSFSKLKISEKEMVNINTVLLEEKNMLEKTLTARIQLDFNLEDELWSVSIDKDDMVDAIVNLSINAMHAIEGNGKLTYTTVNEHINEMDAELLQLDENDYVLLSITDTGCGMNEDVINKIFEPFYSTKGEMGTGLGLSQVYGFMQRCNGNIKVYSEPDHGTRITMYFPRSFDAFSDKDKPVQSTPDTRLQGTETILIVDDEPSLLTLSSKILSQQGYQVFCADGGKEALEILENEAIDLMLSDVIMPEMDGYELSLVVQEKYPKVKIQLVSGFNDNRHVQMSNDDLYKNLIHKPFSSLTLLQKVRELLG